MYLYIRVCGSLWTPLKFKKRLSKEPSQHHDQDSWSNFRLFQQKQQILKHVKNTGFYYEPSLNTIIKQPCVQFCSSYVVLNPTLTYPRAQS